MSTAILGAFYVFLMIDAVFRETQGKSSLTDTIILLLLSIPYMLIFAIGCHTLVLTNMILDEMEQRKKDDTVRRHSRNNSDDRYSSNNTSSRPESRQIV